MRKVYAHYWPVKAAERFILFMFRIVSTLPGDPQKIYYHYRPNFNEMHCNHVIVSNGSDVKINILKFHLSNEGCGAELVTVSLMSVSAERVRWAEQ